jgi:hypothetical protein
MMKKLEFGPKQLQAHVEDEGEWHKVKIVSCGAAMGLIALGMMGFHSNVVYRAW